jgi:hypothetical protein
MLGLSILAGCGDTVSEQVANSPEVQQRLLENEQRRQAERKRQQKQLDEIRNSTEAALRLAEELQPKSASTKAAQPAADTEEKSNSPPVASKVADSAAQVETPKSSSKADETKRQSTSATANPAAGNSAAANSAGWARLRAGLSKTAVEQLLGSPTSTSEDRTLLYWHYGSGAGSGRVAFLSGSGQLVAWESPIRTPLSE